MANGPKYVLASECYIWKPTGKTLAYVPAGVQHLEEEKFPGVQDSPSHQPSRMPTPSLVNLHHPY